MNVIRGSLRRRLCGMLAGVFVLLMSSGCLSVMPALAPKAKNIEPDIGEAFPYESKYIEVAGSTMHYVEQGEGKPIVLLHGNPTSVYLWRNVIPRLSPHGRVIAVDMIGMGKSDKPYLQYTFADHAEFFAGFVEAMELEDVTLVLHDWGGAVGIDYAARNPDNVRGIAVMEAVVQPMQWSDASFPERYLFRKFRDPADGHAIIAEDNYFVERLLPMMSGRRLTEVEMNAYRQPFPTVESRRPIAQWPREIPISGQPKRNVERIGHNYAWLRDKSNTPLLLVHAEPGVIFKAEAVKKQCATTSPVCKPSQ